MAPIPLLARVLGRYQRTSARLLCRRPFAIDTRQPVVSFTFDDFPRSALLYGGAILKRFGLSGTYYASFGLMGEQTAGGAMFLAGDVTALLEQGHELGCHTFAHCDSWETSTAVFERSIIENGVALRRTIPGGSFRTFSYPLSPPRALTKRMVGKHFVCARGGGQTFNGGTADLNYLAAYFLEKNRDHPEAVMELIEQNRRARGWLILVTHDVQESPSPYGCTPDFFETIVRCAVDSGARILPVNQAMDMLRGSP